MTKSFCSQCGHSIKSNASFCSDCGSPVSKYSELYNQNVISDASVYQGNRQDKALNNKKAPLTFKAVAMRFILVITGLMLIFLALKAPIAMFFGQKVNASITSVDRVINSNSSSMDYNYKIYYSFVKDGKSYAGSYQMNKVYNVSKLPRVGSIVVVHYLPSNPIINTPDTDVGILGIQTIFLLLCGIVLFLAGIVPGISVFNIKVNGAR